MANDTPKKAPENNIRMEFNKSGFLVILKNYFSHRIATKDFWLKLMLVFFASGPLGVFLLTGGLALISSVIPFIPAIASTATAVGSGAFVPIIGLFAAFPPLYFIGILALGGVATYFLVKYLLPYVNKMLPKKYKKNKAAQIGLKILNFILAVTLVQTVFLLFGKLVSFLPKLGNFFLDSNKAGIEAGGKLLSGSFINNLVKNSFLGGSLLCLITIPIYLIIDFFSFAKDQTSLEQRIMSSSGYRSPEHPKGNEMVIDNYFKSKPGIYRKFFEATGIISFVKLVEEKKSQSTPTKNDVPAP